MDAPASAFQCGLLRTTSEVCQLLLQEKELSVALQGVCDRLVAIPDGRAVLLVLVDQGAGQMALAETGMASAYAPFLDRIREGWLPECGLRSLEGDGTVVLCRQDVVCVSCPEATGGRKETLLAAPLWCGAGRTGFLLLVLAPSVRVDGGLREAIMGLAQTVADGLGHLFDRAATDRRVQELEQTERRCRLALEAAAAELWEWDIRAGVMHVSPDQREPLDYRVNHAAPGAAGREVHPDDLRQSLAVLADHLAGKSPEYRIEYRVCGKDGSWQWFLDRGQVTERDENGMPLRMAGTHQDITRQKHQDEAVALVRHQLHQALQQERNFLQAVIDGATNPVLVIDFDYTVLLINRAATRLFAADGSTEALRGRKCHQLHGADTPCQDPRFPCPVTQVREQGCQAKLVHNPYHGNRINNTFELEISPLLDSEGRAYAVIEVARDITDRLRIEHELRASQSHLYRLAHHDALTGLPNRLLFADRCAQALNKARRDRSEVAVLFLDLDHFKRINDTLGHDVGDALLVEVAERLQAQRRQSDTVARLGGDEFVFVLDGVNGHEGAAVVAEKIMEAMRTPIMAKGHRLDIGVSIGGALFPRDASTRDELIKCADMALYAAKDAGRNTYQWYRRDLPQARRPQRLEAEHLRRSLEEGRFSVDYLPWFVQPAGTVAGLEARLWWRRPDTGLVRADPFLSLADEGGFLGRLYLWMLARILDDQERWLDLSLGRIPVLMPVSGRLLLDASWPDQAASQWRSGPPADGGLLLGMCERELAGASGPMLSRLDQARAAGFGLAVTESGEGRLPLGRLEHLAPGLLGLGQALVAGLPREQRACRMAASLIGVGQALETPVLACGIAAEGQRDFLRRSGCCLLQGPLLMRALKPDQIPALIQNQPMTG